MSVNRTISISIEKKSRYRSAILLDALLAFAEQPRPSQDGARLACCDVLMTVLADGNCKKASTALLRSVDDLLRMLQSKAIVRRNNPFSQCERFVVVHPQTERRVVINFTRDRSVIIETLPRAATINVKFVGVSTNVALSIFGAAIMHQAQDGRAFQTVDALIDLRRRARIPKDRVLVVKVA